MAVSYSAKFSIKVNDKTKSFTINKLDPQVYNRIEEEETDAMKAVTTFGIAYASAYESSGTLTKATVVKTEEQQVY